MQQEPEKDDDGQLVCPTCFTPLKLIPAGTSKKTGKPYPAFYVCPTKGCEYSWNPPRKKEEKSDMSAFAGDDTLATMRTEINIIKNSLPKIIQEEILRFFEKIVMDNTPGNHDQVDNN